MRRILLATASLVLISCTVQGQNVVKFTSAVTKPPKGSKATIAVKITAKIEDTYHIYSITSPGEGPAPTEVFLPKTVKDYAIDGKVAQSKFEVKLDENFGFNVEYFEKEAIFTVPVKGDLKGKKEVEVHVKYMACNKDGCLPKVTEKLKVSLVEAKK
jgi:hypothetical protein